MNFTEIAKQLYVDQPAVSRQFARLEKELGFSLFIRTTPSVQLTAAGKVFLKEAIDFVKRLKMGLKKEKERNWGNSANSTYHFCSRKEVPP